MAGTGVSPASACSTGSLSIVVWHAAKSAASNTASAQRCRGVFRSAVLGNIASSLRVVCSGDNKDAARIGAESDVILVKGIGSCKPLRLNRCGIHHGAGSWDTLHSAVQIRPNRPVFAREP